MLYDSAGGDVDVTVLGLLGGAPGGETPRLEAYRPLEPARFLDQDSRFVTVTALCAIAGSQRSKR